MTPAVPDEVLDQVERALELCASEAKEDDEGVWYTSGQSAARKALSALRAARRPCKPSCECPECNEM